MRLHLSSQSNDSDNWTNFLQILAHLVSECGKLSTARYRDRRAAHRSHDSGEPVDRDLHTKGNSRWLGHERRAGRAIEVVLRW